MSAIKQTLLDLITLLQQVDEVRHVSMWNNQHRLVESGKMEVFVMPAAFIELESPESLTTIGAGFVAGDIKFRIHLLTNMLDAGDGSMGQNLEIFDIKDAIIKALSFKKLTGCSMLQRTSESQNYDHDNVYEYLIEFATHFIDTKGSKYDSDSTSVIFKDPPTDLEIDIIDVNSLT